MFEEEVVTGNGVTKRVVANSESALAEGVAAVKAEVAPVAPDIHSSEDANKIVSPDNLHTEVRPSVVDNNAVVVPVVEEPVEDKPKKAKK